MDGVISIAGTNKLYCCSNCKTKIKKGDKILFDLDKYGKMNEVFCENCMDDIDIDHGSHPFSSDALGQW